MHGKIFVFWCTRSSHGPAACEHKNRIAIDTRLLAEFTKMAPRSHVGGATALSCPTSSSYPQFLLTIPKYQLSLKHNPRE